VILLIQPKLATTKNKSDVTADGHTIAKDMFSAIGGELVTTKEFSTTEHKGVAPEHPWATAKHNGAASKLAQATIEHECATAEHVNATAEHKSVTALHDLATDCVRLLMHFFHPIQQCAQQVYHTAVPLSPTSSQLHKSCLQSVTDNQLSHVTAFSGAPSTWGSLLRTIGVGPRQLSCITTFVHGIISACGNTVEVYSIVTGVLQQSLCAPEPVTKIKHTPDGSIIVLVHSSSVTMWDVQTGGHIHTFSIQSRISDVAVSATSIACSSSDGSVTSWDIFTKERGQCFSSDNPIITIDWLSHQEHQ